MIPIALLDRPLLLDHQPQTSRLPSSHRFSNQLLSFHFDSLSLLTIKRITTIPQTIPQSFYQQKNTTSKISKMQSFTKIILSLAAVAGLASAAPAADAEKRQTMSGDLTYYTPGLGACGVYNGESDAIVALSWELFDQYTPNGNPNLNSLCGRQVQISLNGKTAVVTVEDRCQGCQYGDLDVPVAVFSQLADPSVGRTQMTWTFL
ncbi:RlpA-like double-psi beta-barrel-protein domain-containing protein-containing protein [Nemania abortiva]|nr:RlpA-like double-psi beta-barrel-protein domain-containing protein-containing protein [Nemania abortiva]